MNSESNEQMLHFVHLPSFSVFLLQHIDAYTKELVRLAYEVNLPLLKHLQHLSEEERFLYSKRLNIEFLTNISQNNAIGHIKAVTERWLSNQFENIGRLDVHAQDITLINYVRSKAQKKFINQYTTDPEIAYRLHSEIDDLSFVFNTKSINDYLQVLKDKIEEEAHFSKNIIEASPGIIFIYDLAEQREVYINGRVEEVTGFKPEEILAAVNPIAQFTHPDDLPVMAHFLRTVMEGNGRKTHQADYRFRNKSGHYLWLRCYAVVYKKSVAGAPLQILAAAFDIGTEKETADALLKREKQLLEAQAIGKIGSFEWDIVKDTTVSTPEIGAIFESDNRQTLAELLLHVHPDDVAKLESALSEAFTTGVYHCEYRYRAKTGEKVIDSRGIVSFDTNKNPVTLMGTIQDVTERKRIEENLLKNTLELQYSNAQLQEFASVASHDLKEPLRKIGMFSNIIMTTDWDQLPERTKSNVQKIADSVERMQQLIEGILAYSSLNTQQEKERCSLEQLLEEALNNLEFKIKETGALISSDGLPQAQVIPFQVQQLFQNLVGNALKFSKKGITPQIKITHSILPAASQHNSKLAYASQYLKIEVADNGIGFNKDAAEKIFGLFQRLHSKADYEGSGLGLAICKRVVENHGGIISAVSELHVGSSFTVILPFQS